ncbi:MAG TPA: hypothetical protein VJ673_07925 [Aromatoleum sp.]|uniref:hypothetical protein n=1 Tax=Aromatoleum sp. TaxID=2307007 RepID=UPI002B4A4210|nr:hypothetical protein [Aromatoleum sp.]HJV25600.1 hypothetical protein [Aromatoleum sp.]
MLATALTIIAIVTQDQAALRAAPRESAAQQAVLWAGDSLEIRGEKGDYLQVYDHRRERAGYIPASQVRVQSLAPDAAPELLTVVRFLKDSAGSEALGISYAAAYLKAAPAQAIDSEVFDALGTMSERLARRASAGRPGKAGEIVAAQLEVAANYGVNMVSFERDGQMQLCPDGEAHRRVLAMPAPESRKAAAALALTRHDCVAPTLTPVERYALDAWRADMLDRVKLENLPEMTKNRIHLRKAGVWASLAWQRARRAELGGAAGGAAAAGAGAGAVQEAGRRAIDELAAINKSELMETYATAYSDAAIRVGASRWAAEPGVPAGTTKASLDVVLSTGQPGETCVHLVDATHDAQHALASRCTYGIVWPASATANRQGTALALAVQPLDTWREMWVFRQDTDGWHVEVLPPALDAPRLGYVEFAGWVPGNAEMLAAREAKLDGRYAQRFEVLSLATLETKKQADRVNNLSTFYRWQDPVWKAQTVSVR